MNSPERLQDVSVSLFKVGQAKRTGAEQAGGVPNSGKRSRSPNALSSSSERPARGRRTSTFFATYCDQRRVLSLPSPPRVPSR